MRVTISRAPGAGRGVTPLELLFDLVYVFAVGELAHHLVAHLDLRTGLEMVVLILAVAYGWFMTAWGVNFLAPDTVPERLLLAGLAFASLLMSVSISGAFDDRAWLFVTGYVALQVGRAAFLAVALRGGPLGAHFVNDLVWEVATGALWIAGAFAGGDARLVLWALAVAVALAGVGTLHRLPGRGRAVDRDGTGVAPAHLIERFRLFFIIALGETVLIAGAAFVSGPVEAATLAALAVAFAGTIALWWCYFQRAEGLAEEEAGAARDAGPVALRGTWTLTLILLALIAVSVADEMAIAHPGDDATLGFTLLAFGGPALFLLAQVLFIGDAVQDLTRSRVVALAALVLLGFATAPLPLLAATAAATAVLVAVAVADTRARR